MIDPPEGSQWLMADGKRLREIYKIMSDTPGVFDDFTLNQPQYFVKLYTSPDTLWLERTDGNGILYLTNIVEHLSAKAHVLFWDKRLRGREAFTKECLKWAMRQLDLKKLNVELPTFAGAAIHFTENMGFTKEGTIRRRSISRGKLYDAVLYGMTIEEAFNG